MKFRIAFLLLAAIPAAASAQTAPSAADRQLKALYDGYADWSAKQYGSFENARGESEQAGYLPKVDPASFAARAAYLKQLLAKLDAIPANRLSLDEQTNAAVLRNILESSLSDARFREWEMPVNSDSNFWTYLDESSPLDDAAAYRRYIARMRDVPRFFAENIANMRAGLARGFTPPAVTLGGRERSISAFTATPEANAFYKTFEAMPSTIGAADQARLRAEGKAAISQAIIPAYRDLLSFYRDSYVPGARKTVGASALPDGDAYYRAEVREYTTLALSPEEIHQLGLKEVARIVADMKRTMAEAGFKGSFADFLKFLRTDPQFIARTPDDLMGVSSYAAKRVDGRLKDYFEVLPRRRFAIIPVPDALAPFYTAGRGGLTSCQMNTYNLPVRPLYNIPVLTLHECAPGHSFQAALAEEGKSPPPLPPQPLFLRLWRGLGPVYRMARDRDGDLSHPLRTLRPAKLRNVARRPAGDRHRPPPLRLVARPGDRLSRSRTPLCRCTRSRPRSIATSAGPARPCPTSLASSPSAACARKRKASLAPSSTSAASIRPCWRWAPFPCPSSKPGCAPGSPPPGRASRAPFAFPPLPLNTTALERAPASVRSLRVGKCGLAVTPPTHEEYLGAYPR